MTSSSRINESKISNHNSVSLAANMHSAPLLGVTPTVNYRDQLVNITVVYIMHKGTV